MIYDLRLGKRPATDKSSSKIEIENLIRWQPLADSKGRGNIYAKVMDGEWFRLLAMFFRLAVLRPQPTPRRHPHVIPSCVQNHRRRLNYRRPRA